MSPETAIQLAHGGGGRIARELIEREIVARFGGEADLPDSATVPTPAGPVVFTTDSFVVSPLEFPGGNIGSLAVHGTVNDLAAAGARPLALSLGLVLEEGLPRDLLGRILDALRDAAQACGVRVVTGDTKVVGRGQCDRIFINTAGIGTPLPGFALSRGAIRPGDRVLLSGPPGDHGMTILALRDNIGIGGALRSDSGPVHRLVEAAQSWAPAVRFMRDPTRGGVAAVLNEIVEGMNWGVELREADLPVNPATHAAAELLGLDLLHVACEGRLLMVCAPDAAPAVLQAWRARPEGGAAAEIGVIGTERGRVALRTLAGGRRLVDWPRGELLPRIC